MKQRTQEFIKRYLPYLQFCAVVLTMTLGIHTVISRFLVPHGPIVEFDEAAFKIEPLLAEPGAYTLASPPGSYKLYLKRRKLRDDCPLTDFVASVVSSTEFSYQVKASIGKTTGAKAEGFEEFNYIFIVPPEVPTGPTIFSGALTYSCKEGIQTVYYPKSPGLMFEVK